MDLMWEYRRLNVPLPVLKPKLSSLQALLNIVLGAILTAFGSLSIVMMLRMPVTRNHGSLSTAELFIGGWIALLVFGIMALRERRRYHRREQK